MRDNWLGMVLFGTGVLAGVVLIALLPGMPWSSTRAVLDLPIPTDEHDLQAQRSMAAAAWYMAAFTATSLVLGGVTLWFLAGNLIEARLARDAANRSAGLAEDALHEAWQANQIAREMGQAQSRAYLMVERVDALITNGGDLEMTIHVRNSGQTPARGISIDVRMETGSSMSQENVPITTLRPDSRTIFDLPGGGGTPERFTFNRMFPVMGGTPLGTNPPIHLLLGQITLRYHDVFSANEMTPVETYLRDQIWPKRMYTAWQMTPVALHMWRRGS